ncbi:MAG: Signal peptidase I, partial [uncultured Acidimicrobiales bacterium]
GGHRDPARSQPARQDRDRPRGPDRDHRRHHHAAADTRGPGLLHPEPVHVAPAGGAGPDRRVQAVVPAPRGPPWRRRRVRRAPRAGGAQGPRCAGLAGDPCRAGGGERGEAEDHRVREADRGAARRAGVQQGRKPVRRRHAAGRAVPAGGPADRRLRAGHRPPRQAVRDGRQPGLVLRQPQVRPHRPFERGGASRRQGLAAGRRLLAV